MARNRATIAFLVALSAIALFLCYLLVAPFLKPIVFAIVLAVLFHPLHTRIHRRIRNRSMAALLSTSAIVLIIALASALLGRAIVSGLHDIYQSLSGPGEGKERLTLFIVHFFDRAIAWAGHYISISVSDVQGAILTHAERAVAGLLAFSAAAVGRLTSLVLDALIAVFVLFFLLRDGRSILRRLAVFAPLKPDQVRRLFACVKSTLDAIVYGTLAMAAIQGVLTGVAFWFLGLTTPALWGVIATLCALLPVIGTTFVLLPAACMLLFSGHWIKAAVLLIWGLVVVHPVDNVLRPYLIGGRARLSTLYVFFALFGGLEAFGALGLILGPLILSITVALFTFLREERRAGNWIIQPQTQPK